MARCQQKAPDSAGGDAEGGHGGVAPHHIIGTAPFQVPGLVFPQAPVSSLFQRCGHIGGGMVAAGAGIQKVQKFTGKSLLHNDYSLVVILNVVYQIFPKSKECKKKDTRKSVSFFLERPMGVEPTYAAWEAAVLPMNYGRKPGSRRPL